ncbi:MAG: hypothetical protein JW744_02195, partial [Candidatus Diapherotrites archaeon]|nr:hypothetical protein [Candidatus Diapherotrites archaeon]
YVAIGKDPIVVGYYTLTKLKFPLSFSPIYGQILGHAFFDGYCDASILRYSNYDKQIRTEFCSSVEKALNGLKINLPKTPKQDINLPVFAVRLLRNIFAVKEFYGSTCRLPKSFFSLVRKNNLFGWYFLKAAYLDEGTITGHGVWIVRSLKNKGLCKDIVALSNILNLSVDLKQTNKEAYSVRVKKDSLISFFNNVSKLILVGGLSKWAKVADKVLLWQNYENSCNLRKIRVVKDCINILNCMKKAPFLTTSDVQSVCNLPSSTAFFRMHLLISTGNVSKQFLNGKNIYYLKDGDLSNLISMNEMRRSYGWR